MSVMEVSHKSWHFRMYLFILSAWAEGPDVFDGARVNHRPKNLCRYFWSIVLMVISIPIWVAIAIILCLVYFVIYIPFDWIRGKYRPGRNRRKAKRAAARLEWDEEQRKKPKKGLGLIESYVKARKAKVCPMIVVVDEEPWKE